MLYAQNISDYIWKNRLIILVDEHLETSAIRSQFNIFSKQTNTLLERDILLIQLTPEAALLGSSKKSSIAPTHIYKSLSISEGFKGVILVGKDGGIKLRKPFEVQAEDIFTLIDCMPMRKSEIKRKQGI